MPAKYLSWTIIALVLLLVVPFILLYRLGAEPLQIWDEARRGVNAFEMLKDFNPAVSHYEGQPEMWGTKPTLLIVIQALAMYLIGPGELAVRLPSALAGLFTCLMILIFSARYLKNPWLGLLWVLVLITAKGFALDIHSARTGDFDALLTLFMFLYAFSFYLFTTTGKHIHLLLMMVSLTLAALTKGIAGLMFLPALGIWGLWTGKLRAILTSRQLWTGMGIFVALVGGYYLFREWLNPGYLKAVADNELGGRYLETIEKHEYGYDFFIRYFKWYRLKYWIWFLLPALVAGFFSKDKLLKNFHLFATILFLSHLIIISLSKTKLRWYELPEYPFIAFLIAHFLWMIANTVRKYMPAGRKILAGVTMALFLALVFFQPIKSAFYDVVHPLKKDYFYRHHELPVILKEGISGQRDLDGYKVVHEGYYAQCLFYQYLLTDKGVEVMRAEKNDLVAGDRALTDQEEVGLYIEANYPFEVIEQGRFVKVYLIGKP